MEANNNLMIGPDGAIFAMVKPPVYDVDNLTVEQGNYLMSQNPAPGAGARMVNLGLKQSLCSVPASTQSLLASSLGTGNLRASFNAALAPFPSGGADAALLQNSAMQHHMGLVPDVSLSSIGALNQAAANQSLMAAHSRGLQASTLQANAAMLHSGRTSTFTAQDPSRTRRRQDDLQELENPSKRMRIVPFSGQMVQSRIQNLPRMASMSGSSPVLTQRTPGSPLVGMPSAPIAGRSCSLNIESDENNLSRYQVLARQQVELFEATEVEASTNAQGRNRPILPGQVGIRCRHCAKVPPKQRKTGAVYYPNRLDGVYQTAQKMTVGHLCKNCNMIPAELREKLLLLKAQKSSDGGGKRYWADGVRSLGIIETPKDGLQFGPSCTL